MSDGAMNKTKDSRIVSSYFGQKSNCVGATSGCVGVKSGCVGETGPSLSKEEWEKISGEIYSHAIKDLELKRPKY